MDNLRLSTTCGRILFLTLSYELCHNNNEVSEVFVTDRATKTFSFVALFCFIHSEILV